MRCARQLAAPKVINALLSVFDDGFRLDHMYGILMTAGMAIAKPQRVLAWSTLQ
jgi:hypothetical protein